MPSGFTSLIRDIWKEQFNNQHPSLLLGYRSQSLKHTLEQTSIWIHILGFQLFHFNRDWLYYTNYQFQYILTQDIS